MTLGTEAGHAVRPSVEEIERVVALAVRAPSIHNTQPWRFVSTPDALELWADRGRQLAVTDADGWAVSVSCGGALYLAALGLAAEDWHTTTERLPDPARPDLLARIRADGREPADESVRQQLTAAGRRHTERRPFRSDAVSAELLDTLCAGVGDPSLYAAVVIRPDDRLDLAVAMSWADALEVMNPAYRAELAKWVRPDATAAGDGIAPADVPGAAPGQPRHTDVPLRDFGAGGPTAAAASDGPSIDEHPAYVVVFSRDDDATTRLRAGEVYTELSVNAERLGLATSAMTQALDLPGVRNRVRTLMSWPDHPQMILRVGWPPVADATPRTRRRPVAAVLTTTGAGHRSTTGEGP
jgi:nitroreductase